MGNRVAITQCPWPAPAKINLFLHITGRRENGYHDLQTVFQFLNIGDSIYFKVRKDGQIRRTSSLPGITPEVDLVVRAARQLQKVSGSRLGVDIHVEKRLPIGGGLGGGSSNAATTLMVLNRLWQLGLSRHALAEIGLGLGADIPVFVHGHAAWAEGIGERLIPIELDEPWYLIVQPDCSILTAEVFADPELTRNTPPITIYDFISGKGHNDCEPVVRARYPKVKEALEWLAQRGDARLSGTGSCVFSRYRTKAEACRHLDSLPQGWKGFVARGLNRSPLLDWLDSDKASEV